jgi:hypothetical protein
MKFTRLIIISLLEEFKVAKYQADEVIQDC